VQGAALSPGQILATFELDNPELVKPASVFDGSLSAAFASTTAPPVVVDSDEKRAHVLLNQSVTKLKEIMSGFVFLPEALARLLTNLQTAVNDPTLPAFEVEEQLSVISSRIPAKLYKNIQTLVESYKTDKNQLFPAQTIISLMEEHINSLTDISERTAFLTTTTPLRDCLEPYSRSTDATSQGSEVSERSDLEASEVTERKENEKSSLRGSLSEGGL